MPRPVGLDDLEMSPVRAIHGQMARTGGVRNSGSAEAVVHFSAPIRQLSAAHPAMLVS
jgi:hypothetical protein